MKTNKRKSSQSQCCNNNNEICFQLSGARKWYKEELVWGYMDVLCHQLLPGHAPCWVSKQYITTSLTVIQVHSLLVRTGLSTGTLVTVAPSGKQPLCTPPSHAGSTGCQTVPFPLPMTRGICHPLAFHVCIYAPFFPSPDTSLWRQRHHQPPKYWYPTTILYSITTQKTLTWIYTTMKTSNLLFFDIVHNLY
jgi:hypothetical protein